MLCRIVRAINLADAIVSRLSTTENRRNPFGQNGIGLRGAE
ncbi:hypothetical protein OCU_18790 [Mycobacterium intracellulare ATCC 13950]|uniref:Uncharacterized protein n=1 Tax=Mycobacterium intracellulare (strain ATCC 13950 / DSM 43223 / JCM 6384 / NCTC 13025 / 3600) TaxID=487521 RepID=H8IR77_MYCIA|nr:hypothetical protein OCU_18790 [Mycobacterium intracellulare ATCC 13950]